MRLFLAVLVLTPSVALGAAPWTNPYAGWSRAEVAMPCDPDGNCATVDSSKAALQVAVSHTPAGGTAFACKVDTQTAETQCQAVPATTGDSHYISGLLISNHGVAQTVSITYGTGTNCATGNTVLIPALAFAINSGLAYKLDPPVQVPANKAICCKPAGANAFSCLVTGFTKTP